MRFRRPSFRQRLVELLQKSLLARFQMTIDSYAEEKVQQEKELKEVQQATFQKLSRTQAAIEFYSGLLKAFNALKEIPFEQRGMHIEQARHAFFLETVEELEG